MSYPADKAREELARIGEDPEVIDWYCRVIDEFFSFGHSGGSFFATLPTLVGLLEQKNLSDLTNDPKEWIDRSEISGYPYWQNSRNSEAFSEDGGITYTLLSDSTHDSRSAIKYTSKDYL